MEIAVFADEIEGREGKRREEKERVEEKKNEGGRDLWLPGFHGNLGSLMISTGFLSFFLFMMRATGLHRFGENQ